MLIKEMTLNRKVTGCFLSLMFPPNISLGKSDREINSLLLGFQSKQSGHISLRKRQREREREKRAEIDREGDNIGK